MWLQYTSKVHNVQTGIRVTPFCISSLQGVTSLNGSLWNLFDLLALPQIRNRKRKQTVSPSVSQDVSLPQQDFFYGDGQNEES